MTSRLRITAFASGKGTTIDHLLRYQERETPNWQVVGVICDNPTAGVLDIAKIHRVPVALVERRQYANSAEFHHAIFRETERQNPDVVFLLGYLRKVGIELTRHFKGRIYNSHPSLLPKYGGKGMYGSAVHQAVMNAAEIESGVSIHEVNENYDEGAVRLQKRITIDKKWAAEHLEDAVKRLEKDTIVEFLDQLCASKT